STPSPEEAFGIARGKFSDEPSQEGVPESDGGGFWRVQVVGRHAGQGGVESFLQVFHQGLALRVQAMGSDTAVVSTCGAVAVHVAHRTRQGAEPQRLVQMYRRRAVDGRPVLGVYQQVRDAQVLS